MDLDDEEAVAAACSEADIVVSTVRHPRHTAERAVLRNGGALRSLASLSLADRVVTAAAWLLVQTSGPAAMADFGYPAMKSAPRRPTQMTDFPEPIGRRRSLYVGRPEIGFFDELANGRDVRIYAWWTQRRTSHEPKRDLVMALQGNRCLGAQYIAGDGDYLMTGAAMAAFSDVLREKLSDEPDLRGVVGAEELFDLGEIRPQLEADGVRIMRQHG